MDKVEQRQLEERVLVLAPTHKDAAMSQGVLKGADLACTLCVDLHYVCRELQAGAAAVLLTEEVLASVEAGVLMEMLVHQPPWSDLPVLVLTRGGGQSALASQLMQRVENMVLLERPVQVATLVSAVRSAVRARRRQYQLRQYLAERQQGEETLRQSEDRFRVAIAATRAMVYEIDLTSNRVSGFDGLYELLGYRPDEVSISRDWWFAQMHPDEGLTIRHADEDFQNSDTYSKEYRIGHKAGHYLHVIDMGKVIRDTSGIPVRVVGSVTDVTQRKQMEMDLKRAKDTAEEASRAKDHFLAVLSHELRTPLTPVMTTVQMLQRDRTLSGSLRESLDMIRRNVELETRLIDDLLDLTRISRGKLQLNLQNVDLHEKVYQVVSICESDIRAKQLGLMLHLNAEQHHVHGDPARLQQVLWNLLKNAIKFTPFGGSISITTANEEGKMSVAVEDTGIGIEAERLVRIFDAFDQGSMDVARLFGGLGLGLSICKGLVDLHGGSISAASEGKDKGATFTVQLPVAVPAEAATSPGGGEPAPLPALGCRILLVEDHADTAKAMRLLLSSFGCTVQVAGSVASALQIASAEQFDLLVSDLGLPDGSGHDLMRQLGLKSPIKGIALSGYGTDGDVRRSIEAGFSAHLTKPVNVDKLEETIRQMHR